jgi:hypothetical protein
MPSDYILCDNDVVVENNTEVRQAALSESTSFSRNPVLGESRR